MWSCLQLLRFLREYLGEKLSTAIAVFLVFHLFLRSVCLRLYPDCSAGMHLRMLCLRLVLCPPHRSAVPAHENVMNRRDSLHDTWDISDWATSCSTRSRCFQWWAASVFRDEVLQTNRAMKGNSYFNWFIDLYYAFLLAVR